MRFALAVAMFATTAFAGEPVLGAGESALQSAAATDAGVVAPELGPDAGVPAPLGETVVTDTKQWAEAKPVGAYNQPSWTDRRRFPGTRVYVAPPGTFTFEFWLENKTPFDGGDVRFRSLYEVAIGLGHRLQLDLYLRTEQKGGDAMRVESERVELRWALADWGVIPGNPTLYLEWIRQTEGPMKGEVKVLLGDSFSERLYWGLNLFYERELWGSDQAHEYGLTGGLSYSLIANKLSLGVETRLEIIDTRASRPAPLEVEFLLGPTMAWRPVPQMHVLLVWFLGAGFERPDPMTAFSGRALMQPTLVAGWRF